MTRDRIHRNDSDVPAQGSTHGALGNTRNFRQEAARADDQLAKTIGELATLYGVQDVRNRGAQ